MASSYSTDLKIELMVTGENAGTWGTKTNDNLNLIQQAICGVDTVTITSTDVTLAMSNSPTLSNARNAVLKLSGTLSANVNVIVPAGIEKTYFVENNCTMSTFTLTFKTASGTGVLLAQGNKYVLYSDGTNTNLISMQQIFRAVSANTTVQPGAGLLVDTSGGAKTITLPASPATGDFVSFIDAKYTFDTNALTVGRNSSNITNAAADLVVNTEGAGFTLVYSGDATVGWTYRDK